MAVATITIRQLLQRITDGEIRIPTFQRDFVWEPDRVQFLMDSIFKGYPIGVAAGANMHQNSRFENAGKLDF